MKLRNTPEEFLNEYRKLCKKYKMHMDILDEFHETMEDGTEINMHNTPIVKHIIDEDDMEEFDMMVDMALLSTYTYATIKYKPTMVATSYMNDKILEIIEKYREYWTKEPNE